MEFVGIWFKASGKSVIKLYISIEPYLTLGLGSRGCQSMLVEVEVFFFLSEAA